MTRNSDIEAISAAAARWVARRDSGLPPAQAAELEQWLAADTRHETAFKHYARTWSALDRASSAGTQGALMRELQVRTKRRHTRRRHFVAAAACATAILVFAVLSHRPHERTGLPASAQSATDPLLANSEEHSPSESLPDADGTTAANPAQRVTVTSPEQRALEDGSIVYLRQGGIINVRYDDTARRVFLISGEAHFQVAKGLPRPFVVVAGGMEVRAVGTAFAVELGANQVEVWVTEGRVAVEKPAPPPAETDEHQIATASEPDETETPAPAAAEPAVVATLGMCERVVVQTTPWAPEPVVTPVSLAEINKRLAWRIPRLEFSATPLAEVVTLINRYSRLPDGSTNTRLVLDASAARLSSEPVSGYFHADDIEAFVRVLSVNMDIVGERHGDTIVLRKIRKIAAQ